MMPGKSGLVGTVNGINYWQIKQKTDVLLKMLLDNDGTFPENNPDNQGKQGQPPENGAPGSGQLELKEWNASETIIDAVQSFEAPAVTKQITLQTDIAKELRMEGDAARIHQFVSLLVDNAVKYTPEGGTIRVWWWKNGKKAELAVENTCDNLPEGDLNRLFDRFYRADASRARESGGYGIGLSVAAAIVQAHKGKITAERTKDGICFRAVFPAK